MNLPNKLQDLPTDRDIADALWYLAELIEATETVATKYRVPLPLCHRHAKAAAIRMGLIRQDFGAPAREMPPIKGTIRAPINL